MRLGAVGRCDDPLEQGIGAVFELHECAFGFVDHLRDVREAEVDLRLRAEHLAGGDARQQRVRDLAGRAGDDDLDHGFFSSAPP